jgi:hypothetical protein
MRLVYAVPFGIITSWLIGSAIASLPHPVTVRLAPYLALVDEVRFFLFIAFLVALARSFEHGKPSKA